MKILLEESLLYAKEFFNSFGECVMYSGATVKPEDVQHAEALIVRSTTQVDAQLLHLNTALKFVGTATAGADHLDTAYLEQRNVTVQTAAGCNAVAVTEYVLSALLHLAVKRRFVLRDKTVGIVGAGYIGSLLFERLSALGVATKLCDPPLEETGDARNFAGLDEIMACDIISLHVPLTFDSHTRWPTFHLFNKARLGSLSDDQILINACRGEVIDNHALLQLKQQGREFAVVMDVWENEPGIDFELAQRVEIATGHIAGHSLEGKGRGTEMMFRAWSQIANRESSFELAQFLPPVQQSVLQPVSDTSDDEAWLSVVRQVYDIEQDSRLFLQTVKSGDAFRHYRKNYAVRREFGSFAVNVGAPSDPTYASAAKAFLALGFDKS